MPEWIQIALRSLAVLVVLFILTRINGKKQLSQLTVFEYIAGITIGSIAAEITTKLEEKLVVGITALIIWAGVPILMEILKMKSKTAREWIEGSGTVLIKDGKVMEENLKKARYNSEDLLEQLREKNVFKTADVEFAVLEPNGKVSVLLKKDKQPLTASHLGVKVGPEQEPQTVIMDGSIMDEPLATIGLNRQWLRTEMDKLGVTLENVYLGQVDSYGQLYVDLYDDQLKVPAPSEKEALLSLVKKCQADLELFASETENQEAKAMYELCAAKMKRVIDEVTPLLQR